MLLPEDGELPLSAAWPPIDELDPGENGAARWAFDKSEPAGWKTGTLPNVRFQFRPLVTSRGVVGVCGFEPADRVAPISPTLEHALNLILEQAAIAIDRAMLVKDSVRTVALEENEKLRGTLLASLSHDLRTPLATITGAVTTLRKFGDGMAAEQRADLLASIEEESAAADPLHRQSARHVADRSRRAEAQAAISSTSPRSSARRSSARARRSPASPSSTSLARDLPFMRCDANLLEQVLFNLLDNAQKYGGGGRVIVHARRDGANVLVSVTDEGPGIKPADLERIFEKFYRGGRADGRQAPAPASACRSAAA